MINSSSRNRFCDFLWGNSPSSSWWKSGFNNLVLQMRFRLFVHQESIQLPASDWLAELCSGQCMILPELAQPVVLTGLFRSSSKNCVQCCPCLGCISESGLCQMKVMVGKPWSSALSAGKVAWKFSIKPGFWQKSGCFTKWNFSLESLPAAKSVDFSSKNRKSKTLQFGGFLSYVTRMIFFLLLNFFVLNRKNVEVEKVFTKRTPFSKQLCY